MAFLSCSKVMLSDGTFKRIDQLQIGESIKTYVTSSDSVTVDGIEMKSIGNYTSASVQSIITSSFVGDYTNKNSRNGNPEAGLYYIKFEDGNVYDESKFSIDTQIYTHQGFASIESTVDSNDIGDSTFILDSLQETEFQNNNGWKKVSNVEFYKVNDNDIDYENSPDSFILKNSPLYTIETSDGNPFIVSNFIIKN